MAYGALFIVRFFVVLCLVIAVSYLSCAVCVMCLCSVVAVRRALFAVGCLCVLVDRCSLLVVHSLLLSGALRGVLCCV